MNIYDVFNNSEPKALDDTIDFECTGCGACCKNIKDIILNPRDIFQIAQYMGLSNKEFISKYCDQYIGNDSKLLVVRIKPSAVCPFFDKGSCGIQPFKPTLCKLYPMGRIQTGEAGLVHFLLKVSCGKRGIPVTVRAWLHKHGVAINDPFDKLWHDTIMSLAIPLVFHPLPIQLQMPLYTMMNELLYCRYFTGDNFEKRFSMNVNELKRFYRDLKII